MSRLNVAIVGLIGITKGGRLLLRGTTGKQKVVVFELASSGGFNVINKEVFVDFADLLGKNGESASVSPLCKDGKCEELAGLIHLPNGNLHPGESLVKNNVLCLDASTPNILAEVTDRFRPTTKATKLDFSMPKVATGALLRSDLAAGGVRIKINNQASDIEPGPVDGGRRIEEPIPATDYVVWIENVPKMHHPSPPGKKPDLHFYLLYDFLHEDDVQRWVPVVNRPEGGIPPGSQCITPIMP